MNPTPAPPLAEAGFSSGASRPSPDTRWPTLPYDDWKDTLATLHMWTQIVGKIRRVQMPWINHSWGVTLYVSARGLTTGPMPHGERTFQIDFDFIDHRLAIRTTTGEERHMDLAPRSVADFHAELFGLLDALLLPVKIHGAPNEVAPAIPFALDHAHASYDAAAANRFWRVLVQVDRVFTRFRAGYVGKSSQSQFFWGSFDLAVTRFSGRRAPPHPGGAPNCPDWVMREGYSHEVASCGFWPGGDATPYALFYAYAYPAPAGYSDAAVRPVAAAYDTDLQEFVLPYEAVRTAADPDAALLAFLASTYEAAANLGNWDRAALEPGPEDGPPGAYRASVAE